MVMLNGTDIPHSVLNNNGCLAVFSFPHTRTHTTTALQCPGQQTIESVWRRERERANTHTCGGNAAVGLVASFRGLVCEVGQEPGAGFGGMAESGLLWAGLEWSHWVLVRQRSIPLPSSPAATCASTLSHSSAARRWCWSSSLCQPTRKWGWKTKGRKRRI